MLAQTRVIFFFSLAIYLSLGTLIISSLFISSSIAKPVVTMPSFRILSTENGLSQNTVNDMLIDKEKGTCSVDNITIGGNTTLISGVDTGKVDDEYDPGF